MASTDGKVFAEWVGPYGYTLLDGTVLGPGVVVEIGEHEAKASDNWKPVSKKKAADASVVVEELPDSEGK